MHDGAISAGSERSLSLTFGPVKKLADPFDDVLETDMCQ